MPKSKLKRVVEHYDWDHRDKIRDVVFKAYGYTIEEDEVRRFHSSRARMKIAASPARTSKSYAGAKDVLVDIVYMMALVHMIPTIRSMMIWIVAPTFALAKEFEYLWEDIIDNPAEGFEFPVVDAHNSPSQGTMDIKLYLGRNRQGRKVFITIVVKSAGNEKQLQSEEVDIALLSEAARMPAKIWDKFLAQRTGRAILPTTPDLEARWIWDLSQQGKAHPHLGIESFSFTPRANPTYDWTRYWIEHQLAESRAGCIDYVLPADASQPCSPVNGHDCFDETTQCKAMTDDHFAEQFGGQWTFHRGRVMPIRREDSEHGAPAHVIHADRDWFGYADCHISFDYGYRDGNVAHFWLIGPKQVVLRREIYETELNPDQFYEAIQSEIDLLRGKYGWPDTKLGRVKRLVGDPQQPAVVDLLRERGLPIWDVDKAAQRARKAGHMELMAYLATDAATGEPRMLIHSDCHKTINEWERLRYNDRVRTEDAPTAFIGADHAYDAARYFVMARPPSRTWVQSPSESEFQRLRRSNVKRGLYKKRQATVPSFTGGLYA